jgi:hypothetical protein
LHVPAGDAHEADDFAISAEQRHFGREEPTELPLFIIPNLQPVDERFAGAKHELVIRKKGLHDMVGEEVAVRAPGEITGGRDAEAVEQVAAAGDEQAVTVLHKVEGIGQMVEDRSQRGWIAQGGEESIMQRGFRHGRIMIVFGGIRTAFLAGCVLP